MIVLEYKRHIKDGVLVTPEWIQDGGYFPLNNTWIGINDDNIKYYIPETVKVLSKDQFINRLSKIKFSKLENPSDPHSDILQLVPREVANEWWEAYVK